MGLVMEGVVREAGRYTSEKTGNTSGFVRIYDGSDIRRVRCTPDEGQQLAARVGQSVRLPVVVRAFNSQVNYDLVPVDVAGTGNGK